MPRRKHRTALARWTGAILLLAASEPALSWGNEGHRITGHVAELLLTPTTRARLSQLLEGGDLPEAAVYADAHRETLDADPRYAGSRLWHFDNRPACGAESGRSTARRNWCPGGRCASSQLERLTSRLRRATLTPAEHATDIRLIVHFVGDIHQPLHAADHLGDRGGNAVTVYWKSGAVVRSTNLHAYWDVDLVRRNLRRTDERKFARGLVTDHAARIPEWSRGSFEAWALESRQLAISRAYGGLPEFACGMPVQQAELSADYIREGAAVVREQLVKAGVRIAAVLNRMLDPAGAAPP